MFYENLKQRFRNFCFGVIEVFQPFVAAVLTAECHANHANLRIRRLKPPLQKVAEPKAEIANSDYIHSST
jgi:hypothetical protein